MTENTTNPSELHSGSETNDFPADILPKADVDSGLQPAVEPAPKHGAALDIADDGEESGTSEDPVSRLPTRLSLADVVIKLKRSYTTPMDDGDPEWHEEDPEWKANHQLSWEDLTSIKEIGKGLTCTVYTAKIPGRKGRVIAKVARAKEKARLQDQAEQQLEAEFNTLRQVKHRNVVDLLGAGFTPDGQRFLLLERLTEGTLGTFDALSEREEMRGPSAYQFLKRGFRRLTRDLKSTLQTLLQVLEALEYLQNDAIPGCLVIHRDLRPDNVGISHEGVVKIFDFGLSKPLPKGFKGRLVLPGVGEVGSLRYAAPEVALGEAHAGKVDVYSWALLSWSVASARPPFADIGRSAFYERVVLGGERPPLDAEWPETFRKLLSECWSSKPTDRPDVREAAQRMRDVVAALK